MMQRLRWLLLALPALALVGTALYTLTARQGGPPTVQRIEVIGDAKFRGVVHSALELLRGKAPDAFAIVQRNVGRIEQSARSGMQADATPPTFLLNDTTAYYSVTWCAGSIAHDSLHSKLYHDYKAAHGEPVPVEVWGGSQAVEQQCLAHQLAVLQAIGAPPHEIEYCRTLDGTHGDANGDGKYDWSDHAKRKW